MQQHTRTTSYKTSAITKKAANQIIVAMLLPFAEDISSTNFSEAAAEMSRPRTRIPCFGRVTGPAHFSPKITRSAVAKLTLKTIDHTQKARPNASHECWTASCSMRERGHQDCYRLRTSLNLFKLLGSSAPGFILTHKENGMNGVNAGCQDCTTPSTTVSRPVAHLF